jgi:hypothetical protein
LAHSAVRGAIEEFQPELDNIAKEHGARRMRMWSNRAGWRKVPQWREVFAMYEREIP